MRVILSVVFCLVLCFTASAQQRAAEDFTGTSIEGKSINLQEQKGKVVVLTFWSTNCAICASEIPKLNRIVDKYAGSDVEFLGLTAENEMKVTAYLRKKSFKFTIIPNSLGVVIKYADKDNQGRINMGFPSYFVINQDGEIVMKGSGYDKTGKLENQINNLLGSRIAKVE